MGFLGLITPTVVDGGGFPVIGRLAIGAMQIRTLARQANYAAELRPKEIL